MPNIYERIGWKNHVVQYPLRRKIEENGDDTYTVSPEPGEIIQQGTKQSAENFNHMDDGIFDIALAQKIYLQSERTEIDFDTIMVTNDEDIKGFMDGDTGPDPHTEVASDEDILDLFRK